MEHIKEDVPYIAGTFTSWNLIPMLKMSELCKLLDPSYDPANFEIRPGMTKKELNLIR